MTDVDYDPSGVETLADPASVHRRLRQECPVHRFDGLENPLYTVANRADVHEMLTDPTLWSNRKGPGVSKSDVNDGDIQRFDPPEHGARRGFVRPALMPGAVNRLEPGVVELANQLIDGLVAREGPEGGRAELHDEYALPLPITGFTEMMGLPPADRAAFKRWADDLVIGMTFPERAIGARRAMAAYTSEQVRVRREALAAGDDLPDGLLSRLAVEDFGEGPMDPREVAGMIGQLLVAGHETTTSLVTNAVWRLLEQPERWHRLLERRELVPNVIEESLRFDPPVLGLCRTNNEPTTIGDVAIPDDSKVMALYASANRDPELFDDPDEFRVDRPLLETKRHYSFGWGIHFCLGAHLARLTGRVALEVLLERLPGLRLAGETERIAAPFLWGRRRLPVAWDRPGTDRGARG